MSLIVEAHNTTDGDVSDYNVRVFINGRVIATLRIKDHVRALGWRELLRKISEAEKEE